jgi:hypothetical protein
MVRRIGFATISALLVAPLLRFVVAHHAQSLARLGGEGGQAKASLSTRILARTSFTFWIAVIFSGRWIAYSYNAFV